MLCLPTYSWIYDVYKAVELGKGLIPDEANIVGGRFSGKSVSIQILFYLLASLPFKVGLVAVRASKDGAKDLFNDFVETWEGFGFQFSANKSALTLKVGVNTVRVVGLNSMSSSKAKVSGFPRFGGVDYVFKYYEERFEFSEVDFNACQEAFRGMGNKCKMVTINVCNPWASSSPYIRYCKSFLDWDIKKMKTTGNQFKVVDDFDKQTEISTVKLFQYTNWRVAKSVLSPSKISEIQYVWRTDRNRAQTVDYGLPGYEWGAIYTHLLHKIAPAVINREPQWIIAGMDYGWSAATNGGKTACVFGTASLSTGIDVLAEWVHDPSLRPLGTDVIADNVVKFYIEQMKDYVYKLNRTLPFYCKVRVDNSAVGVITLLNQSARKFGAENWLSFVPCTKQPIVDRIDVQQAIMSAGMFRMHNQCNALLSDFEQAHYKEEVEKRDRAKGSDHVLNAYEYGIEPCLRQFARQLRPSAITRKDALW